VVNLVGPMWVRSFPITTRCGIVRTKASNVPVRPGRERPERRAHRTPHQRVDDRDDHRLIAQ
jgi:hypothetical protein